MAPGKLLQTPDSDMAEIRNSQRKYFHTQATRSLEFRKDMLRRLKAALKKHERELLTALYRDLKKSPFEAYSNEIGLVYSEITHALKHLRRWMRPRRVRTELHLQPSTGRIIREPYGSVLIMAPWNYPVQLLFLPLVGAMAAGNTAVLKPSEMAEATAAVSEKIIRQTFDPAYIAVVQGDAEKSAFLVDQDFDYLFFTGSARIGKKVMAAASAHLTPVTLELGGKSPAFVDASANPGLAARKIAFGKFNNAGQTCVAPDYVLVDRRIVQSFVNALIQTIRDFYPGLQSNAAKTDRLNTDYARIINKQHFNRLKNLMAATSAPCATGGQCIDEERYIAPSVYYPVCWEDTLMEEEIFGPLLPVIAYDNLDEAMERVRSRPSPLALYAFTRDRKTEKRLMTEISFGGGAVNSTLMHVASHRLPFGGVGSSGMGSYHGQASFDCFSHSKSILRQPGNFDLKIAYPGKTISMKLLRKLMR